MARRLILRSEDATPACAAAAEPKAPGVAATEVEASPKPVSLDGGLEDARVGSPSTARPRAEVSPPGRLAHSPRASAAAERVEAYIKTREAPRSPKRAPVDGDLVLRRWRSLIGRHPPKTLSHVLMDRILAWREQVTEGGDIHSRSRAILAAALANKTIGAEKNGQVHDNPNKRDVGALRHRPRAPVRIGTALIREHAGVLHRVTVVSEGFEWEGRIYASLSAVARAITGVRWNGHRFFALDHARKVRASQEPMSATSARDVHRTGLANPPALEVRHDRRRSLRHLHPRLHRRGS
jgi:Protein of unknown function (DUF2924)